MPALTNANFRLIKSWTEGTVTGKRRKVRRGEVFNGSWGGVTNTMPAAAFGLQVIEECTPGLYATGNRCYDMVPSSDGSVAYLFASTGASSAPADVAIADTPSGLYVTVKGY